MAAVFMNTAQLLEKYRNEDYDDYVKHYLVSHWKHHGSTQDGWRNLVTNNFIQRHTVEGNISEEKAIDVCRSRSAGGTQNFTSTSLTQNFMQAIVKYIADNVIEWHGKNMKNFANYKLKNVKGTMYTVVSHANKGFTPTFYRDSVVVGIDQSGLINHFHGDAQYATGKVYER